MILTPSDMQSSVWLKIKDHLEHKLVIRRLQLEGKMDLDETNRLRGRIAELKDCLKMDEAVTIPVA